ncbi:maleylpyruvate isomerase family mycothiol-dependent enzyme [Streptomyces sp. NBC_01317]|uniref:maleylpyruvate isomerase family mycothiol-dependent enzyme n=1 Tax=Streptomyces sp. NBC_01317 TaxID=2903822 RepID=UPI002E1084C7|nr:maleylpyruvate isomerase family mycothiol-dependent enzyme [Streptomyces sp. NBC_01317]
MTDHAALLARQDDHFASFARTLTDDEWHRPSLCAGWTNRDVLAHLVLGLRLPLSRLLVALGSHRASFDSANADLSRRHGHRHTPAELLDAFDRARVRPRGIGRLLPAPLMLGDHTVHHLDIALALGRPARTAPEVANAVLKIETTVPNPFIPARARARGLTLRTTDTDWHHPGDRNLDVAGTAEHLISVLAGRRHALPRLTGGGTTTLRTRL